eukprot:5012272-Pyramimonas_sp.AAC.1
MPLSRLRGNLPQVAPAALTTTDGYHIAARRGRQQGDDPPPPPPAGADWSGFDVQISPQNLRSPVPSA